MSAVLRIDKQDGRHVFTLARPEKMNALSADLVEALIAALDALKERVGIKKTIRDYGIQEEDFLARLDEMVEQAFDDQCTGANPRYPLVAEIKQLLIDSYYGRAYVEAEGDRTAALSVVAHTKTAAE